MQVCDKKTFAYDQGQTQPCLMDNPDDDAEEDIGTVSLKAPSTSLDEPSGKPVFRVQMSARYLAAYLIQPEDSTDDGRFCEGSRGAYENRSLLGTIKAFLWIGAGIAMALGISRLH